MPRYSSISDDHRHKVQVETTVKWHLAVSSIFLDPVGSPPSPVLIARLTVAFAVLLPLLFTFLNARPFPLQPRALLYVMVNLNTTMIWPWALA